MKRIECRAEDGAQLVVWDSGGKGTPLIFLHGFPQSHLCWDGVIDELRQRAGNRRFITYDLRGFGESSKEGEATWQRLFHDHLAVVQALGLTKYHLVGHDWGGAIALHVARYLPEQLASAVILNTNYWRTDLKGMWHLFFLNLPLGNRLAFRFAPDAIYRTFLERTFNHPENVGQEARAVYRKAFHDPATVDFWIRLYQSMAKTLLRHVSPRVFHRFLPVSRLTLPKSSAAAFRLPITLLWGADDTFNPLWIGQDMERRLRRYDGRVGLVEIADSGHFVPEEQAKEVAQQIARHLAKWE